MKEPTGISLVRIETLCDGVFAIAMTLLVLELKVPAGLKAGKLATYFKRDVITTMAVYLLSFFILGAYWVGTQMQHHFTVKTNRQAIWLNIMLLVFICLIPFSAQLLGNYYNDKLSIIFYSINLLLASVSHLLMLH